MFYCKLRSGERYVFRQGEVASSFFIIDKGVVEVEIDQVVKNSSSKGAGFGELGLLFGAPRSASIASNTSELYLWGLKRGDFKKIRQDITLKNYQANKDLIKTIGFFGITMSFKPRFYDRRTEE